jgi:soluble lytic murein transglycosylase
LKRYKALLFFLLLPIIGFILVVAGYTIFPLTHIPEIINSCLKYEINPILVSAIIMTESRYNPIAQSSANAFGLMQLLPDTAAWLEESVPIVGSWREPDNNIELGVFYLKYLSELFNGDLELVLTAYHQGPGTIKTQMEKQTWQVTGYVWKAKMFYLIYYILYRQLFNPERFRELGPVPTIGF